MKTLVVHPKDSSTSFLENIYKPIINKTVITGGVSKKELIDKIEEHDRVIMMGHGSPYGLFSMGLFEDKGGYIIDGSFITVLKKKNNSFFIWCNADKFVEHYKLKGFYSGMFISEITEAYIFGFRDVKQDIIDESNYGFSNILSEVINNEQEIAYNHVLRSYSVIAKHNPIASYNHNRLYLSK